MPEHDELEQTTNFENQDLAAHFYEGKGLHAKHQSEIVHEKDSYSRDTAEQSFQAALVEKLEADYQTEIDNLIRKRDENVSKFEEYKSKASNLYDDNETILSTFEELTRQQKASRQEETAALEKRDLLQGNLERTMAVLSTVEGELDQQKSALASVRRQLERHNDEIVELTDALEKAQADNGLFASTKAWYYNRKLEDRRNSYGELTEKFVHHSQLIDRYAARKALTEKQADTIRRQMEALQETARSARSASKEFSSIATTISSTYAIRFTEGYQDSKGLDYLQAYGTKKETESIVQDITSKKEDKKTVKKRVQNAEILDMAQTGYTQTVRAASIDGKMYYDNTQLVGDAQADTPRIAASEQVKDKIEQSEETVFLEEEKIISQLKHLPVFQYMNSDTLMEYMEYDEQQGNFIFQQPQQDDADDQTTPPQPSLEDLSRLGFTDDVGFESEDEGHFMRMLGGLWGGIAGVSKFLANTGMDVLSDMLGIKDTQKAQTAAELNDQSGVNSHSFYAHANQAQLAATAVNSLLFKQMKEVGLADSFNHVGTKKLLGLEMLGDTNVSVASGIGSLLGVMKGSHEAYSSFSLGDQQTDYSNFVKKKGLQRFGRVMDRAAAENRVSGFGGATDAAMAGLSTILGLTGIGGLVITGATTGVKVLIKMVGGYLIRRGTTEEILASPHVLGTLQYDKNIINEDHFNTLFAQVTGLHTPDDLATTLKVVDGIDLHRSLRRSLLIPNPEIDRTMAQLGYSDPLTYDKITLKDLHEKIGMTDDWRKTLRNAIEIKGLDYNTNWTRFVKGFTRNQNYYADQKRMTRNELAAKRTAKLKAPKQ